MQKITFNFPFEKINKEERIVTGIATAENVDQSGDVVDFEASQQAFAKWVGNIREMHSRKAVGKAVSYGPVTVNYNGDAYPGIEVSAYISKGAQDTWEKVLDGTLTGFSIGGHVLAKEKEINKSTGESINRITKYFLGELSLVDNPDNPTALFSMVKMADDGSLLYDDSESTAMYKGIALLEENDNDLEESVNKKDLNKAAADTCPECGAGMSDGACPNGHKIEKDVSLNEAREDLGVPSLQNNNNTDSVSSMDLSADQKLSLTKRILKSLGILDDPIITEEQVVEKAVIADETEEAEVDDSIEKDGGSKEVDINELKEAFSSLLDEKLTAVKDEIAKTVDEKIDAKVETLTKSVDEVTEKVAQATESVTEVSEKVEVMDNASAIRKSVDKADDAEEKDEEIKKTSFWNGVFVPREVCEFLGYDS